MSIDDDIEQEAYTAVNAVARMMWPKQRERIMRNIVTGIMRHMGWKEIKLPEDKNG